MKEVVFSTRLNFPSRSEKTEKSMPPETAPLPVVLSQREEKPELSTQCTGQAKHVTHSILSNPSKRVTFLRSI